MLIIHHPPLRLHKGERERDLQHSQTQPGDVCVVFSVLRRMKLIYTLFCFRSVEEAVSLLQCNFDAEMVAEKLQTLTGITKIPGPNNSSSSLSSSSPSLSLSSSTWGQLAMPVLVGWNFHRGRSRRKKSQNRGSECRGKKTLQQEIMVVVLLASADTGLGGFFLRKFFKFVSSCFPPFFAWFSDFYFWVAECWFLGDLLNFSGDFWFWLCCLAAWARGFFARPAFKMW